MLFLSHVIQTLFIPAMTASRNEFTVCVTVLKRSVARGTKNQTLAYHSHIFSFLSTWRYTMNVKLSGYKSNAIPIQSVKCRYVKGTFAQVRVNQYGRRRSADSLQYHLIALDHLHPL